MRRILLIAPTFFPDPTVAGIRVTQWAKHLPEFGWEPLVACRHYGYTATPELLAEQLDPHVQVRYLGPCRAVGANSGSRSPGIGHAIAKQIIEPISVPDMSIWRWRTLRQGALDAAQDFRPEVILTSSPTHSIHDLGAWLSRKVSLPWVADFRDPYMIDVRYQPTGVRGIRAGAHRRFSRRIYEKASLCVHAIPLEGRWAARNYPFARDKIRILTNGIPCELLDSRFLSTSNRSSRISIRAVGHLGAEAVSVILEAIIELEKQGIDVEFRHVGDKPYTAPSATDDRIVFRGRVSHQESLREIAGADVLLMYLDPERAKVNGLSSKLFEYIATGRPIVAINPTRPDRQLLRRLGWCWCLNDPQPAAIIDSLRQAITTQAKPSEGWLTAFRERYNRRNQTKILTEWLDELLR